MRLQQLPKPARILLVAALLGATFVLAYTQARRGESVQLTASRARTVELVKVDGPDLVVQGYDGRFPARLASGKASAGLKPGSSYSVRLFPDASLQLCPLGDVAVSMPTCHDLDVNDSEDLAQWIRSTAMTSNDSN